MKKKNKKYVVYPVEVVYLVLIIILVFGMPSILSFAKSFLFSGMVSVRKVAEIELGSSVYDKGTESSGEEFSENDPTKPKGSIRPEGKIAFMIDDKLMVKNSNNLECYDLKGNKVWTRSLKSSDTEILKWNEKYIIVDKNMGQIALLNLNNEVEIEEKNLGKLDEIAVSKTRLFISLTGKNEVLVLNSALKEAGRISEKNGEIIDIESEFKTSNLICYNTSISDEGFRSFVVIYDEDAKILGTLDLDGSLLFDVFVDENITLVCDDKILMYNKNARPIGVLSLLETIEDADVQGENLFAITSKSGLEKRLVRYDEALEETKEQDLPDTAKFISTGDRKLVVCLDKRIMFYDYGLNLIEDINLMVDIESFEWISDKLFYVVGEDRLIIYSTQ